MDKKEKRARLKALKAKERAAARAALPLSPAELKAMFDALDRALASPCDETLRHTLHWLTAHGHDPEAVVPWLEEHGGYCDCEVLGNVEQHVEFALHEPLE